MSNQFFFGVIWYEHAASKTQDSNRTLLPDETKSKFASTSLLSDVSLATLADSRGFVYIQPLYISKSMLYKNNLEYG